VGAITWSREEVEQTIRERVVDVGQEVHVPLVDARGQATVRILHAQAYRGDPVRRHDDKMDIVGEGPEPLDKVVDEQGTEQQGERGQVPRICHSNELLDPIVAGQIGVEVSVPIKIVERVQFDGQDGRQEGVSRGGLKKGVNSVDIKAILDKGGEGFEAVLQGKEGSHRSFYTEEFY
jgi:hypothetical protein